MILQTFSVGEGQAIIIVGLLALLFWAATKFQSLAGTVLWGITVLVYAMVIGFRMPEEYFHLSLIVTVIMIVIAGAVYWGGRI